MPQWHAPPKEMQLDAAIDRALEDLNLLVEKNPSVQEVLGMDDSELMNHAMRAVTILIGGGQLAVQDPLTLAMLYALGFVVGAQYNATRSTL